ncbi:cell division protein YceG involved in septum cleavage [Peptoniphilus ivorii]|uniref:endolytic transglycosylase MltG n=1 Tax=Aedoeadaptatus ivorii TaxID=54006 RepID=UPI00277F14A4|nr:endolytic transglycosylase MltG [Peptoniphilus ivorii]MDQ0508875.1 cell division protein YceG involved in septum cleavage [Peptoniphilus ivorii]
MKYSGRLARSLVNVLRFLGIVCVLAVLLFVIKWRMNHLFGLTAPENAKDSGIVAEIESSKEQFGKITDAAKNASKETTLLTVEDTTPAAIAARLKELGLINDAEAFRAMAVQSGVANYFTEGTFEISEGASPETILKQLTEDGLQKATRTVTIEIPYNATDEIVADIVAKENLVQDRYTFLTMLQEQGATAKILPGGYEIHAPIKAQDLIDAMTQFSEQPPQEAAPAEEAPQEPAPEEAPAE